MRKNYENLLARVERGGRVGLLTGNKKKVLHRICFSDEKKENLEEIEIKFKSCIVLVVSKLQVRDPDF